jgi:P-type Ca2+ transporter type 2C
MIVKNGLSTRTKEDRDEFQARKRRYGENRKKDPPRRSILSMITDQFKDFIMKVLLAAATVSLGIGIWREGIYKGWYEGVTIYLAVTIIVTVTAANEYFKDK